MTNGQDLIHGQTVYDIDGKAVGQTNNGLTKREYFAAMAMQGIVAGQPYKDYAPAMLSARAVAHADALIEALNS